jgi:hypothetical protein
MLCRECGKSFDRIWITRLSTGYLATIGEFRRTAGVCRRGPANRCRQALQELLQALADVGFFGEEGHNSPARLYSGLHRVRPAQKHIYSGPHASVRRPFPKLVKAVQEITDADIREAVAYEEGHAPEQVGP